MRDGITFSLSEANSQRLSDIAAAPLSPQKHVWRAWIVLLSSDCLGTCSAIDIRMFIREYNANDPKPFVWPILTLSALHATVGSKRWIQFTRNLLTNRGSLLSFRCLRDLNEFSLEERLCLA